VRSAPPAHCRGIALRHRRLETPDARVLDLTEDQLELQKWVHEFSANVVRPAAAEYDEREDFPWPVLQEAATIGLYSLDIFATQWFDESGLGIPLTME
jgi:hypothetical protein